MGKFPIIPWILLAEVLIKLVDGGQITEGNREIENKTF